MPADRAEIMRGIRTFAQVVQYLVDDQGWPLDDPDCLEDDLTAVTYDWDAGELGIPVERLDDLRRFQQMRPLTAGQPWGVFFLEFGGPRLRYTPIRRLLRALVTKKRATGTADTRTWELSDLLFIVITGTGDDVELHVLAFEGDDSQKAEFRSLAWRPAHAPTRHLQRLSEDLLPCLAWPSDENDVESWRKAWREAFKLPVGQAIRDSARLADRMARTARDLRTQIGEALKAENGSGPFSTLMSDIRTQLVSDVNADSFADMCAQTLVYGLLSSRVTNPTDFGSSPIFSAVPVANPFLEALFEQVHDEAVSLDLPGSDLPQLVADLRATNVEAILDQIGSTAKGGDPVIHFYEEFLKKYDSKMRADAGAFYTPQPAVEFIVRAVDEVLRSRFGLQMGIADSASWQEVAERNDFEIPEGVDPAKPFVSMLDPATGTGTFLVEWLRQARRSFLEHRSPGEWPEHLRDRLLPSMHAFELMLAPYAIAHLKVALELHAFGAGDGAMQILLTDTLEHAARQGQLGSMADPVAQEGERASDLKESERFSVVIGNPPYDREQRALGAKGKRKGGVVRYGVPGLLAPLLNSITEPMKERNLGHHLKNVYNDYVYFWRWAVWQATELPPGPGVVAFITASSYLDGVSMGGLRSLLREAFDELWIVDLGGEGRGAQTEQNIFDIRTAVAIGIGVRTGQLNGGDCLVRYLRVGETRFDKLTRLRHLQLNDVSSTVSGTSIDRFTPRSDNQYFGWPEISGLFPWIYSGCQVKRLWPVAESEAVLRRRWRGLLDEVPRLRGNLLRETGSRKVGSRLINLLGDGSRLRSIRDLDIDDAPEGLERYAYRSFDRQWIIADSRVVDAPKRSLWGVRGKHQTYLTTLTSTKLGQGPALTATPYVPDLHHFRGSYGAKNVMPLHRDSGGTEPNVADDLLRALSARLATEVAAEDLLAYVYSLGATAAFADRFSEELAEAAGPIHIPITADPDLFRQAVALGRDLLWWHTWGERFAPDGQTKLPQGSVEEVEPVEGMPDDFDYDSESETLTVGTGTFAPVSQEAWDFEVSGLRVLRSWLGYRMKTRKGRKSSPLDDIRPSRWTQTNELLLVLSIIEHTIEVTPKAAVLLAQIVEGPLIPASDLLTPTPANRKPPKPSRILG
ncbi:MAG: hypothetical protein F4110_12945 [Acidimicrobiaceae bacterium]|nr:hypothetical protein [Acidimicrobiaceae bacterium]MYE98056.1 hypothetical protein [Acidimicrobiaceae bacterium]MYI54865.1 hypothetical protein [Acidimicrobiaceae bacterium]